MEKDFCEQCGNHCPKDDLKCNRGRATFGLEPVEKGEREERGHGRRHHHGEMQDGVIGLLMQCGHRLHHGAADAEELKAKLTAEEQETLEGLLKKLLS